MHCNSFHTVLKAPPARAGAGRDRQGIAIAPSSITPWPDTAGTVPHTLATFL